MIIVTAKHHDGFCLWPSKYTDHCVKSSPWKDGKGDVIREVADACREGGLKFGLYCSPWDRHERSYGTDAYNEHFKNQLRELLTDYGPLTEIWFDGACGEGPNGKKQVYDWDGYYALIRKLQPNALIAICGPDIRWVGNESGHCRESEWSVLNMPPSGGPDFTTADLGSRAKLGDGKHLKWYPAEADVSIRPGWFHHPAEQPRALRDLINIYYDSVGRNAVLLLNVPPDKRGLICESDVKRLGELRAAIEAAFKTDLAKGKPVSASGTSSDKPDHAAGKLADGDPETSWMPGDQGGPVSAIIDLGTETAINQAMLQEDIAQGQRVEEFTLEAWRGDKWEPFAKATTIGYKRLLRFPEIKTSKVRLTITATRARPALTTLGLFRSEIKD